MSEGGKEGGREDKVEDNGMGRGKMRERKKWEGREGEGGAGIGEEEEEEERRLEEGAEESQGKWSKSSPGFAFKPVAPHYSHSQETTQVFILCNQTAEHNVANIHTTVDCTRIHNLKLVQCSSNT